tara:strand:- start:313 stop:636 length:324 start_codon:yes stop_codon:yes gene_type:complete
MAMKNYKIVYKEVMLHHFIVPAKSKKEAAQHVRDRIYWDLDPIDEISDCWGVKDIEILDELPVNLKDENTARWWERVQDSRKNWIELKEEKRLAEEEAKNNKLRTDF